ncbi:MAG: hypothetical protein V1836_03685 [Candidatus Aenigmatarchaeota archaeon]
MSSFLSENFLKIVSLALTIFAILGSIVQFQSFAIQLHGKQTDRLYIMFGQYLAGAPFITASDPEYRKGVLDEVKLNALTNDSFKTKFSFAQIDKYLVEITTDSSGWIFGDDSLLGANYRLWTYPVAVKTTDAVVPGKMLVYVPKEA